MVDLSDSSVAKIERAVRAPLMPSSAGFEEARRSSRRFHRATRTGVSWARKGLSRSPDRMHERTLNSHGRSPAARSMTAGLLSYLPLRTAPMPHVVSPPLRKM